MNQIFLVTYNGNLENVIVSCFATNEEEIKDIFRKVLLEEFADIVIEDSFSFNEKKNMISFRTKRKFNSECITNHCCHILTVKSIKVYEPQNY